MITCGSWTTVKSTCWKLRYGQDQQQSFAKVAQLSGHTKDQVQRIERHALGKLRRQLTPVLHPA
ncbi:hypothetical protein [Cyanobium sp. ATX-6F1]|uniref:hypothetical protein n=1 Tax=Cyanobium sp. ATX-6F1 TaxID=3137388 RepID=UPI0039BDAF19